MDFAKIMKGKERHELGQGHIGEYKTIERGTEGGYNHLLCTCMKFSKTQEKLR